MIEGVGLETKCVIRWGVDDVLELMKQRKILMRKREKVAFAIEVLEELDHHHSAEIGISWDVIETTIDEVLHDRKMRRLVKGVKYD